MTINDIFIGQIVIYDGYNFRVTGFRLPDKVYIKPVGITKKVYRKEIIINVNELCLHKFQ